MPQCKTCQDLTPHRLAVYCKPCKERVLKERKCIICGGEVTSPTITAARCKEHLGFNWFKCSNCGKDHTKKTNKGTYVNSYCSQECWTAYSKGVAVDKKKKSLYPIGSIKNCEAANKHPHCTGKMVVGPDNHTSCGLCLKPYTGRKVAYINNLKW